MTIDKTMTDTRIENESFDELAEGVAAARVILFVGAGVSMSVGLPSWDDLIAHMCDDLGLCGEERNGSSSDFRALAEYYRIRKGDLVGLTKWMQESWRIDQERIAASHIHRQIVSLSFPAIYTTNYDHNLEAAFDVAGKLYRRVVTAGDLPVDDRHMTPIVKFHGDLSDPDSLVIAESDYFARFSFNAPIDPRLKADSFSHPILFIGYSMSDPNIRLLLHMLQRTWRDAGHEDTRPPCYVLLNKPSAVDKAILEDWGVTVFDFEAEHAQAGLERFLDQLVRRVEELRGK